jgi:serine/threonine-protein kinase
MGAPATSTAKGGAAERKGRGLSLGTRLFLLTSALLVLAVGTAVVLTWLRADTIARGSIRETLLKSHSVESTLERLRLERLELLAQQLVADPYLIAYIVEARDRGDTRSIRDLLVGRVGDLGFDFAIVLTLDGRVLTRTDLPSVGEDLSQEPLVDRALSSRSFQAAGIWRERGGLDYAAAVPLLVSGVDLQGLLLTGFALDDPVAQELKELAGTEAAYLVQDDGEWRSLASTLGAPQQAQLLRALAGRPELTASLMDHGEMISALEVELDGAVWISCLAPIPGADGSPVGTSVTLSPLAPAIAPFRRIETVLIAAGAASLLGAFALTFALGRRILRPIRRLVEAATAARGGDYERPLPVDRGDEVGELAGAFNALLSDLREKRDMEAYMVELSRNLPDVPAVAAPGAPERAEKGEAAVLGVELRHYARLPAESDARGALDRLGRDLAVVTARAAEQGGRVAAAAGHRLWVVFPGERGAFAALNTAVDLIEGDPLGGPGTDTAMAVATGAAIHGSVAWGEDRGGTVIGLPVQQLEVFLREAAPGELLLTREVFGRLSSLFKLAELELPERRGLNNPATFYVVTSGVAQQLTRSRLTASRGEPREAAAARGAASGDTLWLPETSSRRMPTLLRLGPGAVVAGRFEIVSRLGQGGMGVVYKARDRELQELVALKMLRPDKWSDQDLIERLKQELKLARRISHGNVLRTFDLGLLDGVPFISMEYVRGLTLRTLLDRLAPGERLPFTAGLRLARQLAQGLAAVHGCGVIHRDFKPANVILEPTGNAKIMDFGIARFSQRFEAGQTTAGAIIGTPGYLAPEQLEGGEVDPRTDLFAYGVVLYEMFTGRLPFQGESLAAILMQTLNGEPTPPRTLWPEMPPALERILLRCLARSPADRYPRAGDALAQLAALHS